MRILFVHPNLVHSKAHFGAIKRLYNLICFMAERGHEVNLACFVDTWEEKFVKYTEALKRICKNIELVPRPKKNLIERILHLALDPYPNSVLHNYSAQMRESINSIVAKGIDVLHVEFTYMGQYINYIPNIKFVTALNADELNFFSTRLYLDKHPWSFRYHLRYKKLRQYELNICKKFDKIFTITGKEARLLSGNLHGIDIDLYPNTVDTNYFEDGFGREERATLVFVGNFIHTPNADGILWFYRHIFPLVKKRIPDIKLLIVGAYPPGKVMELGRDEHVEVTGYVDDVRPYISRGTVFICPVRFGGGMRGKILEALAMGKPCVCTSIGAEGIDISGPEGLVTANTPANFSDEVISFLTKPQSRNLVAERAPSAVKSKYDERIVFSRLENIYTGLLKNKLAK